MVGFPAGGLTDILARAYCEPLSQKLGQPVVVENKPGAGSAIAAGEVAKAAPDGHTFLFTISTTMNQNRVLYRKLPYDADKDFAYVSGFDAGHLPLGVASGVKVNNMTEFVDLARRERVTEEKWGQSRLSLRKVDSDPTFYYLRRGACAWRDGAREQCGG